MTENPEGYHAVDEGYHAVECSSELTPGYIPAIAVCSPREP